VWAEDPVRFAGRGGTGTCGLNREADRMLP
jgi:hypothetical protein